MKKSVLFCVLALSLSLPVFSQTSTQFHSWWMYFGNHRLSEHWSLHTEYQWRRADFATDWQQSLARVGLDYHVNPTLSFTGGYAWIETFPYGEQPIAARFSEHRLWQQAISSQQYGRFGVQHRYRLEQRWLEQPIPGSNAGADYVFRQRARYRLMVSIPLTRSRMDDQTLFLAFYDEVFLGFGKGIRANVLDQNRLYSALGWRFNAHTNLQLGYLNQYVFKPNGTSSERNHTLQFAITHNFDFRGKDKA